MERFDMGYLERRAEAELEAAQSATHPKAVHAHYVLATLYLEMVHASSGTETEQGVAGERAQ